MNKKFSKGFTLIELLVVISIISLLSSVILAAVGEARDRAASSKMIQEVLQIKIALELYKTDNGKYPYAGENEEGSVTGLLKSELVDKKYIPSLSDVSSYNSDLDSTPTLYVTGSAIGYNGVSDHYPSGTLYYSCGGKKIRTYLLLFYSDRELNFNSKFGKIRDDDLYENIYPHPFYSNTNTVGWYCIGE